MESRMVFFRSSCDFCGKKLVNWLGGDFKRWKNVQWAKGVS